MEPIPVCKPLLPTADKLLPYLKRIDVNRYYSNLGPLTQEFEERLATHFAVQPNEVVTSANGTLALVQILKSFNLKPGGVCVMPSWTYTATPAAAIYAGLNPYFIDVDPKSWCIQPKDIMPLLKSQEISAVIPVAPFGAPLDVGAWEKFTVDTGILVIIDAAAGFDSFSAQHRSQKTSIPFMVSLHATKVLGIGEGAVVVTNNADLAKEIRMHGNFGFHNNRESKLPGVNAKLSEYASAIGLAALNEWHDRRKDWQKLSELFAKFVKQNAAIQLSPGFNENWVSSFGIIESNDQPVDQIRIKLTKNKISTLSWWGPGCHRHLAYKNCLRNNLPVTEYLADHVLGLPFWLGLEESQMRQVFRAFEIVQLYGS